MMMMMMMMIQTPHSMQLFGSQVTEIPAAATSVIQITCLEEAPLPYWGAMFTCAPRPLPPSLSFWAPNENIFAV